MQFKPCFLFVYILSVLHRERAREREKRSAWREGGRNNQNATRIRWDPTPERDKRQELERRVQGKREGRRRRRRRGERFDISLPNNAVSIHKEE